LHEVDNDLQEHISINDLNYLFIVIGQCIIGTNAEKQLSYAATDV